MVKWFLRRMISAQCARNNHRDCHFPPTTITLKKNEPACECRCHTRSRACRDRKHRECIGASLPNVVIASVGPRCKCSCHRRH